MSKFTKGQAVSVKGTSKFPAARPGKFLALHPSTKGDFLEVHLDGAAKSGKFRPSQVTAA